MNNMKIGAMTALIGMILAVLAGILESTGIIDISAYGSAVTIILVIAGIVLGLMNIKGAESVPFMVASLVIAGGAVALSVLPFIGDAVQIIFSRVATLVVPAAIVVALMTAYKKLK